jgi:hypothetical protein
MDLWTFVLRAATEGRIVSSGDLTAFQISQAQADKRFWVDPQTGLGFAIVPWSMTTEKDRRREDARCRYHDDKGRRCLLGGAHEGVCVFEA